MRIRRRPLLLSLSSYYSSSSLNPDPCLQQPQEEGRAVDGEERVRELHPDGDLTADPLLVQDLLPKSKQSQMLREEKIQVLDDSFSQQSLDSLVTSDNSGRWCNGESAVHLTKKRRKVFENGDGLKTNAMVKGKPMCSSDSTNAVLNKDTSFDGVVEVVREDGKGKKRKSPAVVMEGSRCSRVNGRGWRCSQQTLVGYSLCEHHLGKGRLRSMSIVRRGQSSSRPKKVYDHVGSLKVADEKEGEDGAGSGEKKGKKKMKIGTMKARSINSLLDETDHLAAATLSSLALSALDSGKALV